MRFVDQTGDLAAMALCFMYREQIKQIDELT